MVTKKTKRGMPPLDERFEFVGDAAKVQRHALSATQYEVLDRLSGHERSLKLWRKTGGPVDDDLRQLWLHEIRQVQRVMSYAGAHEVIVDIIEIVEDAEDFGVLLEHAGQPLSEKRMRVSRQHWLKNVGAPRPRGLLWRNVRRLAEALGIVHAQGLVHGRLSADAVMTEGSDDPDFQLTGFEWSLWLSAGDGRRAQARLGAKAAAARAERYSFAEDWRALGRLVASCLDATVAESGEVKPTNSAQLSVHLSASEVSFLQRLVNPTRLDNLEATSVCRSIDDIVLEIGRASATQAGTFILCFAQHSGLGEAVFDCTGGEIAVDEYRSQLDWVRADLGGGARLLVPRAPDASARLRLVTANMAYALGPLRQDGSAVWDVAMCTRAERRRDDTRIGDVEDHELRQPIEIVTAVRHAIETRARLGPDALDWSAFSQPTPPMAGADEGSLVRQALVLVQVIEAVIKALEIYPVEILAVEVENGRRYAVLRAEPGNDRDRLAKRVGLGESASSLKRLFEDDQRESEAKWCLSTSSSLGANRQNDVAADFTEIGDHAGRHAYWFEIDDDLASDGSWFLRLERDSGTEGQIQRRLRAIKALADRVDLTRMLEDPWRVRRSSRESLDERQRGDERYKDLDGPKQTALNGIWGTLPSYLVVGPPGVGKTHLVTEVVRRRFELERSSRLLLTAQGHDALDHLQKEVRSALSAGGFSDLIVVRSTTPERPASDEDVHSLCSAALRGLSESALVAGAPAQIRDRVHEVANLSSRVKSSKHALVKDERVALNAVSSLVLDAANVVISTANSPDVERLVEAREQFDWVIVEEAARATGPELVGALMLSGRRLLIGDHHQLPPFEADRLGKVLHDHGLVVEALNLADQYVGPLIRDGEITELVSIAADPLSLRSTADTALRLLEPFRTFAMEDRRRTESTGRDRAISSTLTEQRRMDPAIARVVSEAFYEGKLLTRAKRIEKANNDPPPFEVIGGLPTSPLVVIDFKHVSKTGSRSKAEMAPPRFHNPGEVDAVLDVLRLMRARAGAEAPPSLVVLSFYKAQVEKLSERIDAGILDGGLAHLSGFVPAAGTRWISTVDGFQGNEADVVILSLVRNNAYAGTPALGFLRDRRRVNVALSRAKSKLVIVGSLEFLREAVSGVNPDDIVHDLSFLTRMDEAIATLTREKRPDGTPQAVLLAPEMLREGAAAC